MSGIRKNNCNVLCFWGIMLVLILVILWMKHIAFYETTGPAAFFDELLYKENAAAFFEGVQIRSAHYPPLYSLVISSAFFFQQWYDVMMRINGILSTLLVIPIWLLARSFLSPRPAALTVLLTLMIPFQVIYPSFVLSENLFMVIFAFAVLLAMRGVYGGKVYAALFGLTLALAYLTRYLMLPAIPILIVFWITLPWLMQYSNFTIRVLWPNILIMCLCFAAVYSPWLIYTNASDIPLLKSLGFGLSGLKTSEATVGSFVMWSGAYAAYIVLATAPFSLPLWLGFFSAVSQKIKIRGMSRQTAFAWLLLMLTICYWLLATQHSFGAKYNYPQPRYLVGRYLMFLTPLYIVAGLMVLEWLLSFKLILKWWHIVVAAFISGASVYIARWILHGQGIWGFPTAFTYLDFASPDAFFYSNLTTLYIGLACIAILGTIFYAFSRQQGKCRPSFKIAAYIIIFLWLTVIFVNAIERTPININSLHARNLAPVMQAHSSASGKPHPLFYAIGGVSSFTMNQALRFWGSTVEIYRLHPFEGDSVVQPTGTFLMLSNYKYNLPELLSYQVGKDTFCLYQLDRKNKPFYPEIISFGPVRISAGKPFNQQSTGDSAMWLITKNATKWTVVVLGNNELKSVVEEPSFVTAIVPMKLFLKPSEIKIYLKDRLTGAVSKSKVIEVVR